MFKVITTLSWRLDSKDPEAALKQAKEQLNRILNTKPHGREFEDFSVQVSLAPMRDRKQLIHLGEFRLDEVLPYITEEETRREYRVGDQVFNVRMNSDRYFVFNENPYCVACGLQGTRMMLDMNPRDNSPHFNLYAEEDGRLVLMTKDHVLAKSKGGADKSHNFQTQCIICNNLKSDLPLTNQQVLQLRKLLANHDMLPKKELRDLINKTRQEMVIQNSAPSLNKEAKGSENGSASVCASTSCRNDAGQGAEQGNANSVAKNWVAYQVFRSMCLTVRRGNRRVGNAEANPSQAKPANSSRPEACCSSAG
jgi:hypothetical protein